jgi:hypothetical protein
MFCSIRGICTPMVIYTAYLYLFVVLFNDAISNTDYTVSNELLMANNLLEGLRKITKEPVSGQSPILAKIRTWHLSNTSQTCYNLS